jgi:hypothetical protein
MSFTGVVIADSIGGGGTTQGVGAARPSVQATADQSVWRCYRAASSRRRASMTSWCVAT